MIDRRSCARGATTITLVALFGLAPIQAAHADPTPDPSTPSQQQVDDAAQAVTSASAQATALQQQLDAANARLDALTDAAQAAAEKYNGARVLLAQRTAAAQAATAKAKTAAAKAAVAKDQVDDLAAQTYMSGGESFGTLRALVEGTGDLARSAADLDAVTGFRGRTLDDARDTAAQAADAQRAAAVAQLQQKAAAAAAQQAYTAAQAQQTAAQKQQDALEAQQTALVAQLARLNKTSATLEQRRQDGLAAARARAFAGRSAASMADITAPADLPAPNSTAAATAIAFAKSQLGKPYVWAAAGPDTWDCSGLTMAAWGAAGFGLDHYTGSQWQQTKRVALANLAPGDLVFYGTGPSNIHHVGMYVGNGQMIEAPHTGAFVRYSSIYRGDLLPYGGRVG